MNDVVTRLPDTQHWVAKLQAMADAAAVLVTPDGEEPPQFSILEELGIDVESAQDEFNREQFEARQGYNNASALSSAAASDNRQDQLARERMMAVHVTSASSSIARQFSENLNRTINNRIGEIETNMDQLHAAVASDQGQLNIAQSALPDAEENVQILETEVAADTAQVGRADTWEESAETEFDTLADRWQAAHDAYEAALEAGDMEAAEEFLAESHRLAEGLRQGSNTIATTERVSDEADAALDDSEARLQAAIDHRNGIVATISELEARIEGNQALLGEYQAELDSLRQLQDYIVESDLEGRLERGEITREQAEIELRDNGMSEAMIERLDGQELNSQNIALATNDRLASIETNFENHNVPTTGVGLNPNATMTTQYAAVAPGVEVTQPEGAPQVGPQPVQVAANVTTAPPTNAMG